MGQLKPMERYPVVFLTSILLFVIFIPGPAQGLCIGPEACGIITGGVPLDANGTTLHSSILIRDLAKNQTMAPSLCSFTRGYGNTYWVPNGHSSK